MKYFSLMLALMLCGCVYHLRPRGEQKETPATHPLNFEGIPMRASVDDIMRAEPRFKLAQKSADGQVQLLYGDGLKPFGIETTAGTAALLDNRLAQVFVKFERSNSAAMYQALVGAFGPPSVEITPGQCTEDYVGCGATWYYSVDALTFDGPESRWSIVDTTMIKDVLARMGQATAR